MKTVKTLVLLAAVVILGLVGFVYSGLFNVAATKQDGPLLTWLLHTTMERSVQRRADDIRVPPMDDQAMILAGLSDYTEMCAGCHGAPGREPDYVGQGLNPAPPELDHLAGQWNAAEQYWIIMNGVRMTGMPAFGKTHSPEDIWPVVAFLQAARGMTESEYRHLKEAAQDQGHHASDEREGQNQGTDGHRNDPNNDARSKRHDDHEHSH